VSRGGPPASDRLQAWVAACLDAHRICMETVTYLQAREPRVDPEGIRLLFNCADLCRMAASLLRGGWELQGRIGAVCAEVCQESARYCDGFAGDPRLRACADACRRCADACLQAALAA
jgi:Domain of Unknown Function (DUF326)